MLSEQLLIDRAGNFCASENHRLMAGWDKPKPAKEYKPNSVLLRALSQMESEGFTKFLVGDVQTFTGFKASGDDIRQALAYKKSLEPPTGLVTYAEEKALEELFDPDPALNFSTVHTRLGEEREVECMELLASATGLNFVATGENQVHIHMNGIGCTPDGIVLDDIDLAETGAEVKCKSPLVHARNMLIKDGEQLKAEEFEHFVQVQTAMLVTGANHWYFANFNPYAKLDALKFGYIIVQRDQPFIEILQARIDWAKKIKAEFAKKFETAVQMDKAA